MKDVCNVFFCQLFLNSMAKQWLNDFFSFFCILYFKFCIILVQLQFQTRSFILFYDIYTKKIE